MARDNNTLIVGIDIGSVNIRTIIVQQSNNEQQPRIIGVGSAPSFGIRRGVITDVADVTKALVQSVLGFK